MLEIIANPPFYIPMIVAAVALTLIYQGNNRQDKRMKLVGVICSLLAVLIVVIGYLVESTEEKVARQTLEVAAAVDARDWAKFSALLDPDVRFDPIYRGREQLVAGAKNTVERVVVKDIAITGVTVKAEPGAYQVDFTATADIESAGGRRPTNWRFLWSKSPQSDEYLLYDIKPVAGMMIDEQMIRSRLEKP